MADDSTISYGNSSDSAPSGNPAPDSGQAGAGSPAPGTGAPQGAGSSQNNADEEAEPADEESAPAPKGNKSVSYSSQNDNAETSEEEAPAPDRSNMVKPTVAESAAGVAGGAADVAETAYEKMIKAGAEGEMRAGKMKMIAAAVVLLIVIIAAVFLLKGGAPATSTITYTTVATVNYQLSSCGTISSPGSYTIGSDILTRISNGACIVIKSNNVKLTGSNVQLTGSGPFLNKPPYTYGILVENASNVSIQGFNVTKFSYDVYFENSSHTSVSNSFIGNATMADISISNAPFTAVVNDIIYGASNPAGSVLIGTGSNGTAIVNSIIEFNAYYGTATYSTNTIFKGDTFLGNQVDLYCGAGAPAYSSSGTYLNSKCNINRQCNFASCTKSNYDFSPGSYNLSNQVSTCGTLSSPGTYTLDSNLNLAYFVNVSRDKAACLTVSSPDVKLNCNGKSVVNSYYGIYGNGVFNVSLENCNFSNDTYGAYFIGSGELKFSNDSYSKGTYGVYMSNDSFANITNNRYYDNKYGAYLGSSSADIRGANATGNTYGLSTNGSTSGVLENSSIIGNKVDLYCSSNSYNRSGFITSSTACGSSDCNWAVGLCKTHVLPPLAAFPINSCTTFSIPGNYSLNTNLIPTGTCMRFDSSNVKLNCNGHALEYNGASNSASALYAKSVSNITIINCNTDNFPYGLSAYNVSGLLLGSSVISQAHTAVNMSGAALSVLENVSAYNYSSYGLHINSMKQSFVINNRAYSLSNNATGYLITGNSTRDIITNNTASNNKNTGFVFESSNDNLVANNTASSNAKDYACNPASSGIYSELNGINKGLTKSGCIWLVELPPSALSPSCAAINTVNGYKIAHDMLYTYGATCFSIYNSNKTTLTDGSYINCEGHTIYALNGGTFADIFNTSSITIENCFLKNFTQAVVSSAKSTTVINTTIADSTNGIVLNGADGSVIRNVNISNATDYAVMLNRSENDAISGLNVKDSANGIGFNATFSTISDSSVYGTATGVSCNTASQTTNKDLGGNSCSSTDCAWFTSTYCKA